MSDFIKAEKVVATALGLLVRELTLPSLVWRDAAGDFAGAKNDTISIRLPAYATAHTRDLRSGAARTKDSLYERKIDVTLDTDVYKYVGISDEELTLDIADFGSQVLNPIVGGIGRQLEQELADEIAGATYQTTITHTSGTDDPYATIVDCRSYLNNAYVPLAGRKLVVGSEFEALILKSEQFVRADHSGASASSVMQDSNIGRVAGFDVYSSPAIAPDAAFAFHTTAFVLSNRAPVVPSGLPWGATSTYQGLSLRTARIFDPDSVEDRLLVDSWCGTNVVTDTGHFDADPAAGGKFIPVTDPANPLTGQTNAWQDDTDRLVRAVKITVA